MPRGAYVVPFRQLRMTDVDSVGGKNASLGEMLSQLEAANIRVPDGFATTAEAFRDFLDAGKLRQRIADALGALDVDDVQALVKTGAAIRAWVVDTPFPAALKMIFVFTIKSLQQNVQVISRSQCVPVQRPRTCRMRRSPASRRAT